MNKILITLIALIPGLSFAAATGENIDLTSHAAGYIALVIFVTAYFFVTVETKLAIIFEQAKPGEFREPGQSGEFR